MSAVRWPVEDHEPHPLVISMPMHVGNMRRYSRRRLRFLYHGTLSSCTKRLMIVSSPPAPIAILSSISFPSDEAAGADGSRGVEYDALSRTRLEFYMLSGIQVPLAMLNLFAKRHIESQRTTDCGKDHVVGVLVLIHGPSGVIAWPLHLCEPLWGGQNTYGLTPVADSNIEKWLLVCRLMLFLWQKLRSSASSPTGRSAATLYDRRERCQDGSRETEKGR